MEVVICHGLIRPLVELGVYIKPKGVQQRKTTVNAVIFMVAEAGLKPTTSSYELLKSQFSLAFLWFLPFLRKPGGRENPLKYA